VRQNFAEAEFMYVPGAIVQHHIQPERARLRYFFHRCYSEGVSKAAVARRAGSNAALSSERSYVVSNLSRGVLAGIRDGLRGDFEGFARSAMSVVGLAATTGGYVLGLARSRRVAPVAPS
jgi:hypothetical protein